MSNVTFNYAEARALAARSGLLMGALWTGSFLCSIFSFDHLVLGHVGNLLVLLSLFVLISILRKYGRRTADFSFLRRWWVAWNTCMYGSLLTTFCQYLYFNFLDGGHMIQSLSRMLEKPEYQEALQAISPNIDSSEILSAFSEMTIGSMIASLLTFNLMASLLASIIGALFSSTHPDKSKIPTNQERDDISTQ